MKWETASPGAKRCMGVRQPRRCCQWVPVVPINIDRQIGVES
jgi:hypothetical protein